VPAWSATALIGDPEVTSEAPPPMKVPGCGVGVDGACCRAVSSETGHARRLARAVRLDAVRLIPSPPAPDQFLLRVEPLDLRTWVRMALIASTILVASRSTSCSAEPAPPGRW
jgi:hypothetical protein